MISVTRAKGLVAMTMRRLLTSASFAFSAAPQLGHSENWLKKTTTTTRLGEIDKESGIPGAHLKRKARESFCACVRFGTDFSVFVAVLFTIHREELRSNFHICNLDCRLCLNSYQSCILLHASIS